MKIDMVLSADLDAVSEQTRELHAMGFDGVEIPLFNPDDAQIARTREALRDLGLACTTGAICTPETNPISENSSIRAAALDHLKRHIDWTVAIGGDRERREGSAGRSCQNSGSD